MHVNSLVFNLISCSLSPALVKKWVFFFFFIRVIFFYKVSGTITMVLCLDFQGTSCGLAARSIVQEEHPVRPILEEGGGGEG